MKNIEYVKLAFELGVKVLELIQNKKYEKTVWDILPAKYKDREKLKELMDHAESIYPRG